MQKVFEICQKHQPRDPISSVNYKINTKKATKCIIVKLMKSKDKEKNIATRGQKTHYIWEQR